jgi:ferritin-like metal-binding protein YciE
MQQNYNDLIEPCPLPGVTVLRGSAGAGASRESHEDEESGRPVPDRVARNLSRGETAAQGTAEDGQGLLFLGAAQRLREHLEETRHHVERLEEVFREMEQKAKGKTCEAMEGLVSEGADIMDHADEPAARDAGLIAAAQKVEHYEIAAYGCLATWANRMGRNRVTDLLRQTLSEEKAADEKLTQIAERKSNVGAAGNAPDQGNARQQGVESAREQEEEPEHSTVGASNTPY